MTNDRPHSISATDLPGRALPQAFDAPPTMPQPPGAGPAGSTQALDSVRDELLALDPRSLLTVNVDVASAALVVIGALPGIQTYRAALVALCGEEMTKSMDRLELYARAALQAHAKHLCLAAGADLQPLSEQLAGVRDVLLAEVRSLIVRKVLTAQFIRELSPGHGYKNQCVDVLQLVSAMKDNWDVVELETRTTMAYLDGAEGLANEVATAVSVRDQAARSPSADLRQRTYTLLARTYDEVRRMISFLRWHEGDADRIAPTFHNHRGSRGRPRKTATAMEVTRDTNEREVPPPGMPGAPPFAEG